MKVFVQIVDTKTGIYQTGGIEEPVKEGFEIINALAHFGIRDVNWITKGTEWIEGNFQYGIGTITDTTKIVSVITINQVVSDQPSYLIQV